MANTIPDLDNLSEDHLNDHEDEHDIENDHDHDHDDDEDDSIVNASEDSHVIQIVKVGDDYEIQTAVTSGAYTADDGIDSIETVYLNNCPSVVKWIISVSCIICIGLIFMYGCYIGCCTEGNHNNGGLNQLSNGPNTSYTRHEYIHSPDGTSYAVGHSDSGHGTQVVQVTSVTVHSGSHGNSGSEILSLNGGGSDGGGGGGGGE